jgi:hypothetical protein
MAKQEFPLRLIRIHPVDDEFIDTVMNSHGRE